MKTVGAYEAKTHLPRLLAEVQQGQKILITKHGVPVALLQPVEQQPVRDYAEVIQKIRAFGQKHSLKGLSLRDMIEEGRP